MAKASANKPLTKSVTVAIRFGELADTYTVNGDKWYGDESANSGVVSYVWDMSNVTNVQDAINNYDHITVVPDASGTKIANVHYTQANGYNTVYFYVESGDYVRQNGYKDSQYQRLKQFVDQWIFKVIQVKV
jgi:hypothetical protein